MVRIYSVSDRIPVVVGEVKFWVSPLSREQRVKLTSLSQRVSGQDIEASLDAALTAIKYGLKEIEGVEGSDGQPYQLQFGADGGLTDDCLSDLAQLDALPKLTRICIQWALTSVEDPQDLRVRHEELLARNLAAGSITQAEYDKGMKHYPLDGLTIDFSEVKSVKKKPSGQPPA